MTNKSATGHNRYESYDKTIKMESFIPSEVELKESDTTAGNKATPT